ncbi:MAG: heme-degrading domain-containing protein [Vallitalea sp.]|jgi:uncharacterized protein (UPF0303 family)|nr:heme-degrading domain-containing protein [Vallitalea sp.]
MKEKIVKELERVKEGQKDLIFNAFNNDTAWTLGNMIYNKAKELGHAITISITLGGQKLFHYSFEGTAPTNDDWICRKENTVYKLFKSSYEMYLSAQLMEEDFMEYFGLPNTDYVLAGGSIPIRVKDVGVVGTITVSGLAQDEDHNFVTEVVREYLS